MVANAGQEDGREPGDKNKHEGFHIQTFPQPFNSAKILLLLSPFFTWATISNKAHPAALSFIMLSFRFGEIRRN